jgi:hypothetical protein
MRSDGRFSDGPPETLEELLEEIVDEFTVEAGDDDDRSGIFWTPAGATWLGPAKRLLLANRSC